MTLQLQKQQCGERKKQVNRSFVTQSDACYNITVLEIYNKITKKGGTLSKFG